MRGKDLVGELRLTFNIDPCWVVVRILGRVKDGAEVREGGDNTGNTLLALLGPLSKCKLNKSNELLDF